MKIEDKIQISEQMRKHLGCGDVVTKNDVMNILCPRLDPENGKKREAEFIERALCAMGELIGLEQTDNCEIYYSENMDYPHPKFVIEYYPWGSSKTQKQPNESEQS